jgi:hypothetical protein
MSKFCALAAFLAAVFAFAAWQTPGHAQVDKRKQGQDWGLAERMIKDKDAVVEAVDALKSLEGNTDHALALAMLKYFEECDRAWEAVAGEKDAPKESKGRPREAYRIANAILECVRGMDDPKEAAKFAANINDRSGYPLRARMAMLDAVISNASDEDCLNILLTLAKNEDKAQDNDMRILAVIELGSKAGGEQSILSVLLQTLRDQSWRVRDASVEALVRASNSSNQDQIILALINALALETGKMRKTVADALYSITREDLGTDADAWVEWFQNKKRADEGLPPKSGKGDRGTRVRVFETESFSDRYIFLIDTSVSMLEKIKEADKEKLRRSITDGPGEAKDPRRPLDWSQINCKLDLAREEMIRSLEIMDPERTTFTVIAFDDTTTVWQDELVPTDKKNVEAVAKWLRAFKGGKRTNVYGALDAAYDLSESIGGAEVEKRGKKPPRNAKGPITGKHPDDSMPDTIFIYTDGYATSGKYGGDDKAWASKSPEEKTKLYGVYMKDMIAEIKDRNRIARITLHTIGVGMPQDRHTLAPLASSCGGKYVPIGN